MCSCSWFWYNTIMTGFIDPIASSRLQRTKNAPAVGTSNISQSSGVSLGGDFRAARAAASFPHSPYPALQSARHTLSSAWQPRKEHDVVQFCKRSLERTMSPNVRLIVILSHASPPFSPINSHALLLSPPPLSPCPPTANDCRHLSSLAHCE